MDGDKPTISLVNLETNVIHGLNEHEMIVGRGWLECDDKRISRKHAVLRIMHTDSLIVLPLHQNPMFFKRKDTNELMILEKGNSAVLVAGDSFGLLPELFWFGIRNNTDNSNAAQNLIENPSAESTKIETESTKIETQAMGVTGDDLSSRGNDENGDSTRFSETLLTNELENRQLSTSGNGAASISDVVDQQQGDQYTADINGADTKDEKKTDAEAPHVESLVQADANTATTSSIAINAEENVQLAAGLSASTMNTEAEAVKSPTKDAIVQTDLNIKQEPDAGEASASSNPTIKTEPTSSTDLDGNVQRIRIKQEFKTEVKSEPMDVQPSDGATCSGGGAGEPTRRPCCQYGVRCYRRNPLHRVEEAHPGDPDYTQPEFDEPPSSAPPCPFGGLCYRRNPTHFQQFWHPKPKNKRAAEPSTKTRKLEDNEHDDLPKKRPRVSYHTEHHSDSDEPETEDPFADSDDGSEYNPGNSSVAESSQEIVETEYDSDELRADEEASAREIDDQTNVNTESTANTESTNVASETTNDEETPDVGSTETQENSNTAAEVDIYDADTDENE